MVNSWLQYALKASTIHVLYQLVKKTLKDATEQSYLKQTPCTKIRLPKNRQVRVRVMTKKEQHVLESCAKGLPLHKGSYVLLTLNTGLRIGGIAALRWTNIDLSILNFIS